MQRALQIVVCDAREHVTYIDNKRARDGLDRLELAFLVDLEAWVSQSRKEGDKARVCVLRYSYIVLLACDLVILRDSSVPRTVMVDRIGRKRVSLIPLVEEVSCQLKAYRYVTQDLSRYLAAQSVLSLHEGCEGAALVCPVGPGRGLMNRVILLLGRHLVEVHSHVVDLNMARVIVDERG